MNKGDIIQLAHVGRDMDAAMAHYWNTLGIGPWSVYTLEAPLLYDSIVRGAPSDHTYRLALAWRGPVQMELVQPLSGRSIYDDFLESHGEGLHHLKLYYPDCRTALATFAAKGIDVIQSGKIDKDEFYYLDTEQSLGVVVEIGNNGTIREPEATYPA